MAAEVNIKDNNILSNMLEIAKGYFLYSVWIKNIYININDVIPKGGTQT